MKNKIGWCNLTWNPVWGCRNNCPYCYAREIARRFWKQRYMEEINYHFKLHPNWVWTGDHLQGLRDFEPVWLESKFQRKLPKKPQRIFVGSMSEIEFWREDWMRRVIEKIKEYPQHVFQFLTKHPKIYSQWLWPENCWLGITATDNATLRDAYFVVRHERIKFINIEPILGPVDIMVALENRLDVNWVIVGAETGSRKGKVIPEKKWILDIVRCCVNEDIPLYLKDSMKDIYPEEIKEFPKEKK